MAKIRYINAYECQECYSTHPTEEEAKECCKSNYIKLDGYECKSCNKFYDELIDARNCCPEPKPMSFKDIGYDLEDPIPEDQTYDEIIIGNLIIRKDIKEEGDLLI